MHINLLILSSPHSFTAFISVFQGGLFILLMAAVSYTIHSGELYKSICGCNWDPFGSTKCVMTPQEDST